MKEAKFILICGNLLKHKYFAIKVIKAVSNCYVIFEKYPSNISKDYSNKQSKIVNHHFKNVLKTDKKFFYKYVKLNNNLLKSKTILNIKKGKLNTMKVFNLVQKYDPSLIILCASSIVKGKLLSYYQNKIINHHAGLCQYFRGSGCNVWAIYYKRIEDIGVTIHFIDNAIDTGPIIIQSKPIINKYPYNRLQSS